MCRTIQRYFNNEVRELRLVKFSDGEILVCLDDEPSSESVVVLQAISAPVNDNLIHTLFVLETLRKACVSNIILVITYLAYSRQDRRTHKLSTATASTVCKLLSFENVSRAYVIEPHSPNIVSFFNVPSFEISIAAVVCNHISRICDLSITVVIALDQGGVSRASRVAAALGVPIVTAVKRRNNNDVSITFQNAEVSGKIGIIIDDIVDTGQSIAKAADTLVHHHTMSHVLVCCTHAVMSKYSVNNIRVISSNSTKEAPAAALDLSYIVSRLLKRVLALKRHNELL